ncbi:MAG: amidohydrolase family protein [Verrucomicrobiae bacterium]|nr:amidohydrolase family protein [Verrucomicrobiae bacterium]
MKIIDVHCHVGKGIHKELSAQKLLKIMDDHGVDRAGICPVDEEIAVRNKEGNLFLLDLARKWPDRFMGFAVANPWYGKQAIEELRRAINEGLRGLKINSALQGFFLNDPLVYPLIEEAQRLRIPVYCHTGTPVGALPSQLADLASLFPQVVFIMGHAGYTDFWYDVIPSAKKAPNILIELSHFNNVPTIRKAMSELGCERFLFGSDSPVSSIAVELDKIRLLKLSQNDEERVLFGNMNGALG